MRVLFTTLGSPSHGRAQLPLARVLCAAGHEVLAATAPSVSSIFEEEDVRVTTCLTDTVTSLAPHLDEFARQPDLDEEQRGQLMLRIVLLAQSSSMAKMALDALLPVAQDFRPDIILRDGMDLGACLLAEKLGIPQLPTPSGSSNVFDPAELLPGLNALREEYGLPTRDDPLSIVRHGRIDYVPPAFSFAKYLPPSLSYRQTVSVERRSVLPGWVAELPTDRPLLFAAVGTALPMADGTPSDDRNPRPPMPIPDPTEGLGSMIKAVSRLEECTVIVATSGIPADTDGLPPHVRVTDRLPQPLLLESVDVFLTHGGFNSIREALRTATPMAVLPFFGDQHDNARRVQELGVGREVTDPTPDGIAAACRAVLADSASQAKARQARLAMLALPEIDSAVTDLEKIAG
jgi:UDP:flavonoid glycosyltransferase YjiC (YdhE family)